MTYTAPHKITVLSSQDFWRAMCSTGFIRTGPNEGVVGDILCVTAEPPERIPGFIEGQMLGAAINLGFAELSVRMVRDLILAREAERG